jgi:uncharacterized protein (TIGR01777 family)
VARLPDDLERRSADFELTMPVFESRSEMPVSAAELFRWHARPGAFERLVPPWERVTIVSMSGGIGTGARVVVRVGTPPFAMNWTAVHRDYEEGRRFVDAQESGPFARWIHEHRFEDAGPGRSMLVDRVEYALPLGALGALLGGGFARRQLERMFAYRHAVTREDLARHAPFVGRPKLRVAITGASGLLGSALAAFLTTGGHEVVRFVRGRAAGADELAWDPAQGRIEQEKLEGLDAVVHLAGENIAASRWTERRKAAILESRTRGTRLVVETLAKLAAKPKVFLSASAVGFYGDRGAERLDESSSPGAGFLAEVVRAWESATEPAEAAGIRTVKMRLGVILTPRGGALAKMLLPFKLGAGGPIGGGRQGFSWIALDDAVYAIHHLMRDETARGPVNVVSPDPVTQREFALALGRALHRPAFAPLPAFVVKALFGRMGEEALLGGQFVEPAALYRAGFAWSAGHVEGALAAALGAARGRM